MSSQEGHADVVHALIEANARINQQTKVNLLVLSTKSLHLYCHPNEQDFHSCIPPPLQLYSSLTFCLLFQLLSTYDIISCSFLHLLPFIYPSFFYISHISSSSLLSSFSLTTLPKDGKRAIDLAKDKGHMKVIQLLLQSGAQVCIQ